MTFAKFEENRFRIDGEIAENHAILVNLTASNVSLDYTISIILTIVYSCSQLPPALGVFR